MNKFIQILFIFLLCVYSVSNAQNPGNVQSKDYSSFPVWIKMMDDPNTNYYEAIKAFDEYWLTHTKPVLEEEEEMSEENDFGEMKREVKKEMKKDQSVILTEEQWKKKNDDEQMKYNVKRFERWLKDVKPFVQEDGRILTDEEREKIWKLQNSIE